MKRLLAIFFLTLLPLSAVATTYNTSTTLVTTSCESGTSSSCSDSKTYLWSSQAVSASATIYVTSSGSALHGVADADYSVDSGGSFTNFKHWSSVSWSSETDSAVIVITNLSTLQVKLSVSADAGLYTSSITPSAIYVTATAASGNKVIWFNTGEKLEFPSPWNTKEREKEMAYQLASYTTSSGITLTDAYLRITSVNVQHAAKEAIVSYSIFASKAAATAGSDPVKTDGYSFYDSSDGNTLLYTNNFACALGTDPSGTQPTTVNNIAQTQAYLALKNHPSLTTLLTGATAV